MSIEKEIFSKWQDWSKRDDWHLKFVGSDIRQMLGEIVRLRSARDGQTFYGFYEDASQTPDQPTYDPPHDAPCPFCGTKITSDDVRTHSLMYAAPQYAKRAYFYRTHHTCAEKDKSHTAMDGFILDMIARNGD